MGANMEDFDWVNYLKDNFENFKNSVLDEMINYYGKEYKQILI